MINIKTRSLGILAMIMLVMGGICKAQDVRELRHEVQRQKAALEEQRKALDDQTKRLDELMLRLTIVEKAQTDCSTASK